MGEIVLAIGASHAPGITGYPERADPEQVSRFLAGMEAARRALEEAQPDVIIEISNDHLRNFYLQNMPAICIGTATSYEGPWEEQRFVGITKTTVPGHRELAKAILQEGLNRGFDLAFSEDLELGHAEMVPLHFLTPEWNIPVVPIMVNDIVEPLPLPRRVYQLGGLIRDVVAARPKGERVAVVGTGGLSHWVGTPETGRINVEFDERFLETAERGRGDVLAEWTSYDIGKGGNGAHEVRNWIAAMGTIPGVRGEVTTYEPVEPWITGCGVIIWRP